MKKINKEFEKIKHKSEFCQFIGFKLGIQPNTLETYLRSNNIPKMHLFRINKAIELQLQFDERTEKEHEELFFDL